MPVNKLFFIKKANLEKELYRQNVDIQTSKFTITKSADDVPWTLNVKREPFLIFFEESLKFHVSCDNVCTGPAELGGKGSGPPPPIFRQIS